MKRIALSKAALMAGLLHFHRCGVKHTASGADFAPEAFSPDQWARINGEKWLQVTDAADAPALPEDPQDLKQRIIDAIGRLAEDEFLKSGAPDLGALRTALPDDADAITGALRDAVWAEMEAAGNQNSSSAKTD